MDYNKLAELLFPHITKTPEEYEALYPPRQLPEDAKVTRLGPSPTGFIHLGNLYGAFVDERLAHQSGGKFYLRIEDTDDKRYVEGAVEIIINSLRFFGINFDEGATMEGDLPVLCQEAGQRGQGISMLPDRRRDCRNPLSAGSSEAYSGNLLPIRKMQSTHL